MIAPYILSYSAQFFCQVMYQPSPDCTPIISATMSAVQAELMACVMPWKMLGRAEGMETCVTSWRELAPRMRAAS